MINALFYRCFGLACLGASVLRDFVRNRDWQSNNFTQLYDECFHFHSFTVNDALIPRGDDVEIFRFGKQVLPINFCTFHFFPPHLITSNFSCTCQRTGLWISSNLMLSLVSFILIILDYRVWCIERNITRHYPMDGPTEDLTFKNMDFNMWFRLLVKIKEETVCQWLSIIDHVLDI